MKRLALGLSVIAALGGCDALSGRSAIKCEGQFFADATLKKSVPESRIYVIDDPKKRVEFFDGKRERLIDICEGLTVSDCTPTFEEHNIDFTAFRPTGGNIDLSFALDRQSGKIVHYQTDLFAENGNRFDGACSKTGMPEETPNKF